MHVQNPVRRSNLRRGLATTVKYEAEYATVLAVAGVDVVALGVRESCWTVWYLVGRRNPIPPLGEALPKDNIGFVMAPSPLPRIESDKGTSIGI